MNPVETCKTEAGRALKEVDLAGVRGGYPAGAGPHSPEKPSGAPVPRFPRLPQWLRPIKPPPGTTPPIIVLPTA